MLDTETKRRIDSCRDILVGKVPDPKSQVEQITIALIYKFMSDMDAESVELGGKRKFFSGDYRKYEWSQLVAPGMGGHDMLHLYSEAITQMSQNTGLPELFRDIFKNAYLPYRDPETLRAFLKEINTFTYDHSERLGDAFEYLLSVLGAQGDAGQFRTPRHIIDFMVEVIDPKKNESILDPACGTAGFLISSYKHIRAANTQNKPGDLLTADDKKRLVKNIRGYDISPDMVRLSLVNLYLHGFTEPHIDEYDTLTSEEKWNEQADIILANPPFMSPKGGIKPHKRFAIQSKRSEVLFVDYIIEHLRPNGRAAIIVPEGVHFVAQGGHAGVRRTLLENNLLVADITLPHGVFKPYASVKTHILVIDRKLGKQADSVLFVEVENDGFSQNDTRDAVAGSQLDAALKHFGSFEKAMGDKRQWVKPDDDVRSYAISKEVLLGSSTTHLLGRWHDLSNRVIHRGDVPLMRIGELCEIRDGLSPNMASPPGDYIMVVPAKDRKTTDHWDFEGKAVCVPLVSSAGHGKAAIKRIHYQEGKFALATTMSALFIKDEAVIRPRYLHVFLSAMSQELLVPLMCGATNVTMKSSQLADVMIPVPKTSLQDEVVESDLINTQTEAMANIALTLRNLSSKKKIILLAERIISEMEVLQKTAEKMVDVSKFLPS